MKKSTISRLLSFLFILIGSGLASAQGDFSYHYIIPPGLGDRLQGVQKLAFMEFSYTPPQIPGQETTKEDFNTEEELLRLMVEKQKKELLGDEAYAQLMASKGSSSGPATMGDALASNITSILIIPDRGKNSAITFLLAGLRTDPYTIIDRTDIDRILNEQQFQLSGVVDGQQMSEIGALLGADAIINGDLASTFIDEKIPEKVIPIYKSVPDGVDDKGKTKYKQVLDYYRYQYSSQRKVTSTFSITVTSVKTGQILGSQNYTAASSDMKTNTFDKARPADDKKYPAFDQLEPINSLVRKTVNPLSRSAANYLAPQFATTTQKISKVKAKEYKDISKEAADYLEAGRVEKAYAIYQTIYDADPYVTESAFNLGMIYEATGQYDNALELYTNALDLAVKNSNEKKYDEAVDRAKNGVLVINQLNAIGVQLERKGFSTDAAESLMAEKVKTKGNPQKDRWEVYESADPTSTVIGKVPGGREFPSFGVEGNYTKIEIIGGKKGYISNSNLN